MKKCQSHVLDTLQRAGHCIDDDAPLRDGVNSSGSRRALDGFVNVLE